MLSQKLTRYVSLFPKMITRRRGIAPHLYNAAASAVHVPIPITAVSSDSLISLQLHGLSLKRNLATLPANQNIKKVSFTFVSANGEDKEIVTGHVGDSLLDVAHDNDIEIEGACGGEMACSTCHVILEKRIYDKLAKPVDEEEDMLDLAIGLTPTSRLGCQVKLTDDMVRFLERTCWH